MSKQGPTQGAERHAAVVDRWKSHPWLAKLLRVVIFAAPLASAISFTWFAGRVFPADKLGVNRWLWLLGVFLLSNLLLAAVRFGTNRLMPLVALMKLTLVFPDNAPSRTKAALRKSSSRSMLRKMEEARARGDESGAALYGDYLVQLLKDVNDHDRLTRGHSERVRAYSELLGEELKLGEDDMHLLRWSALLHDVGKLSVPPEVLTKDGRPTEEEWLVLSGHPAVGGQLLEPLRPWLGDWIHSADQHHCRWDGTGYPEKLAGTDIAFSGRLVAIADAYDVMTSARSYKKPLPAEVARLELTDCAGSQFDPAMVRAFLRIGLGRLRTVGGPLAWLANLTGSGQIRLPAGGALTNAGWSAGTASVGLSVAAISGFLPFLDTAPETLALVEPVVIAADDVETAGVEGSQIEVVLTASGGEGEIVFSLGAPVHGTAVLASERVDGEPRSETTTALATYSPADGYFGEDRFSFEACDSQDRCDIGEVTITVSRANRPPIAANDSITIGMGEKAIVEVLRNDSDPDRDQLRLTNVRTPSHGTASMQAGTVLYEPDNGYTGSDRLQYVIADSKGASAVGTVDILVLDTADEPTTTTTSTSLTTTTERSVPSTTTAPVGNRPPTAIDDSITVDEDTSALIDVVANDVDLDNDPLTLSGVGGPLHGTATIESGQVRYTPNSNYFGPDHLSYSTSDGVNPSAAASLAITVIPVNDPPNASAPASAIAENAIVGTHVFSVTASDPDNDPLTFQIAAGDPTNRFAVNGSGAVTLAAPLDFEVTPSYSLQMVVSDGRLSRQVLATVTVANINEPPTAADDGGSGYTTSEGNPFTTADVTANDTDVDDPVDPTSVAIVSTTTNGTLTNNGNGTFDYNPNLNYVGTDTFAYTITDPGTLASNTATVTVLVAPVNDPPVANDDGGAGYTTTEDTAFTTADLTSNDTDVDDPVDPSSVAIVSTTTNGTLTNNGNGTLDYNPNLNYSGTDTFTYTITDGTLTSNTATVTLTITAVNDPPVANDDGGAGYTTAEDTAFTTAVVTANDTDVDDPVDSSSVTVNSGVTNGTLTNNGNGTFDYNPDLNWSGTDTFTYTITDPGTLTSNTATVTVLVAPVNDPPAANDDGGAGYTTTEDTAFTTTDVTTNDTDVDDPVDPSSVAIVSTTTNGTLTNNSNGTFDYNPDLNYAGTDTFTYTITDPGTLTSNTATVTLTITPINDPPTAVDDTATTLEDTPFTTADLTSNDTDIDDPVDSTSVAIVSTTTNGTLTNNGNGTFDYNPNLNYTGTDTFTYTITDGTLTSNTATVTVLITPVNDPPVAVDDGGAGYTTQEDTPFTTAVVTANDTDVDDAVDSSSVTVISGVTNGTLTNNSNGTFDYNPDLNWSGTDSFTYTITDPGTLTSNTATVTLTITPVNDPPVANDDGGAGYTTQEDTAFTTADVTANDSDTDDPVDPTSVAIVSTTTNGTLTNNGNGTFDYNPNLNYTGTDTFTYTITDGTLTSNTATVTLTISPINDPPVAVDDGGIGYTTPKNAAFTTADVATNDSDVDDAVDPTSVAIVSTTTNGTLTNNGNGTFDYNPNLNYVGTDTFTYTITDGTLTSNTATVTLSITSSTGLVISEYSNVGDSLLTNDFIELYNASAFAIDIEGWTLEVANDSSITQTITLTGPATLIPPGGHYLLATGTGQDQTLSGSLTDSFAARVKDGPLVIDTVGTKARIWSGPVPAALWAEGVGLSPLVDAPPYTPSWERKSAGGFGNCVDTDDNAADFIRNFTSSQTNPQSSASPVTPCGTPVAPTPPNHLVISEYRTDGPTGGTDEFLEVFNPTSSPMSLNGFLLQTTLGATTYVFPNVILAPGQHYLVGGPGYAGPVDATGVGFGNSEGARLFDTGTSSMIDDIGIGITPPWLPKLEGRIAQSYERRFNGCQDSAAASSWLDDFIHQSTSTPSRSTDPATPC